MPMRRFLTPFNPEVWDVPQAVEYMKKLEPLKPWFIEEPTAPDDAVGHAAIRKALKPINIGVATGEHAHNRVSQNIPKHPNTPLKQSI